MLRPALEADRPGIAALWQEAFGDSRAAVDFFFRSFPRRLSYVAEEAGDILAMVHALPQTLSPDIPAAYLYAVATGRPYRGQGLCRRLMEFAEADLKRRGFACCVLTPGDRELFRFYEALGYETAFYRSHSAAAGGQPVSAAEYAALREKILSVPHMIYDEATLNYAKNVYGLTFFRTKNGCCAAGPGYTAERLPEDQSGGPCAMVKWLGASRLPGGAYLGFALE